MFNKMGSLTIDNQAVLETTQDVQDFLLYPTTTYPANIENNVPNGSSNGQVPLWYSGGYTLTGNTSIRIGRDAGFTNFKDHSIALGTNAGRHENGTASIAIGFNAGRTHSGTNAIAIGYLAGNMTQGVSTVAIGDGAGKNSQGDWAVSIGIAAGSTGQKNNSISIGAASGNFNQGTNSIAIGLYSGFTAQGENCIAIGNQAGMTAQPNNSIVLSASGNPLSGNTSNAFFVEPIRNSTNGSNVLCYDTANKEISYASNISLSNPLIVPVGSLSSCSVQFASNANTGIYQSSTNTLSLVTTGAARIFVSSSGFVTIYQPLTLSSTTTIANGTASSPSLQFSGTSSNTGIYLVGTDNVGFSSDGVLRADYNTTRWNYSIPITLPSTGGTASNLDFYQELTHTSGWNFGSTNSNVQSGNFRFVRIGKLVTMTITYDWSSALTMGDAGGGTAVMNTAVISVFRPSQTLSFIGFAQVGGSNTTVRVLQNTSGTTEITPLAGGNFANGTTLRLWTNSFSYSLT